MQRHGTQYSAFEANRTRIHKTSYGFTFLEIFSGQTSYRFGIFPRSLSSLCIKTMDDNVSCN